MTQSVALLDINEIEIRLIELNKKELPNIDSIIKSKTKVKDWYPDSFGPVYGPGSSGYNWDNDDIDYDKIIQENRKQAINKLLDDEDTDDTDRSIQSEDGDKE